MTDLVEKALKLAASKEAAFPSAQVERALESENDLGNLLSWNENDLDLDKLTSENEDERERYLQEIARDNAQILYNAIWELPTERNEEAIVACLPPPSYVLPREKPAPKAKPLTKWEQYAKEKGIVKTKAKSRMVWDDVVKNWVPRFGYKKVKAEEEKNWMMHYKEKGPETDVDPFEKAAKDKSERVAKNELQRLRNIARAKKVTVPGVGLAPLTAKSAAAPTVTASHELIKAADLAKKSTASLGKFQEKLPAAMEKKVKPQGNKRKFDPLIQDSNKEKSKNLEILEKLSSKKSKLDVSKAVGRQIQGEERAREAEKREGGGKGKKNANRSKTASKKNAGKRNRKQGKKGKK